MADFKTVTYVSTKGHHKPAIVVVDAENYNEGTSLELNEGHAHLQVFGVNSVSPRHNVPSKAAAEAAQAEENEGLEVPELRGYFF